MIGARDYSRGHEVWEESGQALLYLSIIASFPSLDFHKEKTRILLAGHWTLLACIVFACPVANNRKTRSVTMSSF
jgi:hypothetical protein